MRSQETIRFYQHMRIARINKSIVSNTTSSVMLK